MGNVGLGEVLTFEGAVELLKEKKHVESLVSFTVYQFGEDGLEAEGALVPFDYVSEEEKDGGWREVEVLGTLDSNAFNEYQLMLSEDKDELLEDAYQHIAFREKGLRE